MTTDHFDSYVEDAVYREASPDGAHPPEDDVSHGFTGEQGPAADPGAPAKPKKKVPTPMILIGGVVLFAVGMTAYKKFTAPPQPSYAAISANGSSGGMIGAPHPAFPHPTTRLPAPQDGVPSRSAINTVPDPGVGASSVAPQAQTTPGGFNPALPNAVGASGGPAGSTPTAVAFAAPASASNTAPSQSSLALPSAATSSDAGSDSAVDDGAGGSSGTKKQAAEIARLKAQVKSLQAQLDNAPSGASDSSVVGGLTSLAPVAHSTSSTAHRKGLHTERKHEKHGAAGKDAKATGTPSSLSNLHIKQVIPGQGWVEDESTGKQQVVTVGDMIGSAKVTKIDADNYRIETTQGVIQ